MPVFKKMVGIKPTQNTKKDSLFVRLLKRFLLRKHKFKPTDIIKTPNGDTLFEVLGCYYNTNLDPVIEIQMYNTNTRGFVTGSDIEYYEHYKGATPGSPVYN